MNVMWSYETCVNSVFCNLTSAMEHDSGKNDFVLETRRFDKDVVKTCLRD